jgi:hypothetical protein
MSTRSIKKMFLGVEHGRCVGLAILSPSVSRFSRQCGILDISRPVAWIALFYTYYMQRIEREGSSEGLRPSLRDSPRERN